MNAGNVLRITTDAEWTAASGRKERENRQYDARGGEKVCRCESQFVNDFQRGRIVIE